MNNGSEGQTHLDIFSGFGGFAIAAQWAGFRTVAFCESDARCRTFLEKRWGLPVHPDIRKLDGRLYAGVSLLTGGPPCQPASRAGKQGGKGDDRWLWPEALRVLEEAKPGAVVFENPPGILDVGLDGILSEMGRIGYEVQCFDIPACAVDSPQLRHRIWIVGFLGDALRESSQRDARSVSGTEAPVSSARKSDGNIADRSSDAGESAVADTTGARRDGQEGKEQYVQRRALLSTRPGDGERTAWQNAIWVPCADSKLRRAPDGSQRMADGLPVELLEVLAEEISPIYEESSKADHYQPHRSILAALGNSICPQVAYEILKGVAQFAK